MCDEIQDVNKLKKMLLESNKRIEILQTLITEYINSLVDDRTNIIVDEYGEHLKAFDRFLTKSLNVLTHRDYFSEIKLKYTKRKYSQICLKWLKSLPNYKNIQHAENNGEYRIPGTRYSADGYDPTTNTIYEFHGTYWHGDPRVYEADEINHANRCTFGELYEKTKSKEETIKSLGYNLVVMWENDFVNAMKKDKNINRNCAGESIEATKIRLVNLAKIYKCGLIDDKILAVSEAKKEIRRKAKEAVKAKKRKELEEYERKKAKCSAELVNKMQIYGGVLNHDTRRTVDSFDISVKTTNTDLKKIIDAPEIDSTEYEKLKNIDQLSDNDKFMIKKHVFRKFYNYHGLISVNLLKELGTRFIKDKVQTRKMLDDGILDISDSEKRNQKHKVCLEFLGYFGLTFGSIKTLTPREITECLLTHHEKITDMKSVKHVCRLMGTKIPKLPKKIIIDEKISETKEEQTYRDQLLRYINGKLEAFYGLKIKSINRNRKSNYKLYDDFQKLFDENWNIKI